MVTSISKPVLAPFSYPIWVWGFFFVIFFAFAYTLNDLPGYMRAAGQLRSAGKACDSGEYDNAVSLYRQVLVSYPTSKEAKIGAAVALFANTSHDDDDSALTYLEGLFLNDADYKKIQKVMPPGYEQFFEDVKH